MSNMIVLLEYLAILLDIFISKIVWHQACLYRVKGLGRCGKTPFLRLYTPNVLFSPEVWKFGL